MTDPLWTGQELIAALGLTAPTSAASVAVESIVIDSRQAAAGDLFVALPGDPGPRFTATQRSDRDGHDYLAAAEAAGAVAAVVARTKVVDTNVARSAGALQLLPVSDTLDGLWALGRFRRQQLPGPVIAVTGSSGKTTAKAFLAAALGAEATAGSLNNHLGVPLSLARTRRNAALTVVEIGMNHPGEIAPLARLAAPDIAVVVNVGTAHRENFATLDGIRKEKLLIAEGLKPGGTLVLHDEIDAHDCPGNPAAVLRFGLAEDSHVQLLDVQGLSARFRVGREIVSAAVPGGGKHRALTLAAVFAVGMALSRPLAAVQSLAQDLVPAGRGQVAIARGCALIDDSYNANPASMTAALEQLADAPPLGGGRFALLGAMKELGAATADEHRATLLRARTLDGVWLIGSEWGETDGLGVPVLGHWRTFDPATQARLIEVLQSRLERNDNILIKGSNSVFWAVGFARRLGQGLAGRAAE
ncbi:MAG: UDP-N-acetylmuramoyl-tripeptide--D-alanyl-D-alanine ligase [Pseudomonadota bacterium]